jgi:hypothetical protein
MAIADESQNHQSIIERAGKFPLGPVQVRLPFDDQNLKNDSVLCIFTVLKKQPGANVIKLFLSVIYGF